MRREWVVVIAVTLLVLGFRTQGTARALPQAPAAQAESSDVTDLLVHWLSGDPSGTEAAVDRLPGDSKGEILPPPPPPSDGKEPPKPSAVEQAEDVVPIAGDSSGPVDEIMDNARMAAPGWFLANGVHAQASVTRWAVPLAPRAAPLTQTIAFFTGLRNGSIEMTIASPEALPADQVARLMTARLLLVPVEAAARKEMAKSLSSAMKKGSGAHVRHIKLAAYCVEAQKPQPAADALFMLADRATREQFAPMRTVRRAGELAAAVGALKPQGDWDAYGRFVTQYAIWTKLEHWDQARFTDEFITRSKHAFKADHKAWTPAVEDTLRASAPNRWNDIRVVLDASERVSKLQSARSGGVR